MLCVVTLSGCYRETIRATVTSKGKVNGTITFEFNRAALLELGATEDASASGSTKGRKKLPKGVTVKEVKSADYTGVRYTLKNASPAAFAYVIANQVLDTGDPGGQVLFREGNTWRFSLENAGSTAVDDEPEDDEVPPTTIEGSEEDVKARNQAAVLAKYPPRIIISITFPGAVTSASDGATISGKTVSWDFVVPTDKATPTPKVFAVANAK
jgi:hypothetical protein